jgi:AcrR family transcriptional regulator
MRLGRILRPHNQRTFACEELSDSLSDLKFLALNNVKRKLIQAGGDLFARQGYGATSLRAVTAYAGVNLGLVNYHFFSKRGLYLSVINSAVAALNVRELVLNPHDDDAIDFLPITDVSHTHLLESIVAWEILKPTGFKDEILATLSALPSHFVALNHLVAAFRHSHPNSIS